MSRKILIIEEEAILAKHMRRCLERNGYEVRVAASGEAGLEEFERFLPDIVVLDHHQPGMDGLETLIRLRTMQTGASMIATTC